MDWIDYREKLGIGFNVFGDVFYDEDKNYFIFPKGAE